MMLGAILALSLLSPVEFEIHYMPPGTQLELKIEKKLVEVRYFTFEEYKLLLKMDDDLWSTNAVLAIYRDVDKKYGGVLLQKDVIIRSLQDDIVVKNKRLKRLEKLWHEAEELAIDNAGGPIWPYVVGGAGAVVGIIGATLYVASGAK